MISEFAFWQWTLRFASAVRLKPLKVYAVKRLLTLR